jgi:hypothetical protein
MKLLSITRFPTKHWLLVFPQQGPYPANDSPMSIQYSTVGITLFTKAVDDVSIVQFADGISLFVQDKTTPVHLQSIKNAEWRHIVVWAGGSLL